MNSILYLVPLLFLSGCFTTERGASSSAASAPVGEITLPPGVSLADALREDQAVWIALLNNTAFREAMSDVGLAEADILQAKTLPNPTLAMMFPAGAETARVRREIPDRGDLVAAETGRDRED